MKDLPHPRLVVDFDRDYSPLHANSPRCDYLLIAEPKKGFGWVVLLELKRGRMDADQIVRQLRAGASAAEAIVTQQEEFQFRPVVASGSVPKYKRRAIRKQSNMILFHGCKEPIRLMSCGEQLNSVLDR